MTDPNWQQLSELYISDSVIMCLVSNCSKAFVETYFCIPYNYLSLYPWVEKRLSKVLRKIVSFWKKKTLKKSYLTAIKKKFLLLFTQHHRHSSVTQAGPNTRLLNELEITHLWTSLLSFFSSSFANNSSLLYL